MQRVGVSGAGMDGDSMTARAYSALFWLLAVGTLGAIVAVVVRIARTPGSAYPVTSAVLAAILLLGLLYLAAREYLNRDSDADAEYQRRVMKDMAGNIDQRDR